MTSRDVTVVAGKGPEWLRAHKCWCWLLLRAHPGATSATLCCPVPGGERGEGGRLRPSRDGALGVLPGKGGSRRGAEGLWQGLDLMAGTHRVLRLGTGGSPGGILLHQGKEQQGQEVAEPSQQLQQAQGTQQVLTAAGAASREWAGGRGEPREREETQRHSYCSGGAAGPP